MSALPHTIASPVIGPVLRQERTEAIDILRGVAILGILIVNMGRFSLPEDLPAYQLWPNIVDRTVEKLILFFADEQFITLFAFLFGLGLAVQMMRRRGSATSDSEKTTPGFESSGLLVGFFKQGVIDRFFR